MKFFKPPKPVKMNPEQINHSELTAYQKRLIENEGKNRLIHGLEANIK